MVCSPVVTHVSIRRIIMGLNKSKKLSKKSIKPTKVVEELDDVEELEDDVEELEDDVEELEDDVEELEDDVEEPVKKARKSMGAKKAKVYDAEDDAEDDAEGDAEEVSFDTDAVVNGILCDKKSLTSAVYQVQLRLPADIEPMYKGLTPKLKKALRDAFGELIRKAYAQTH